MSLEVEATYEGGVLRPDAPLPLKDHQRVVVSVRAAPSSEDEQTRRGRARERLMKLFARIDETTRQVPDKEMEAAIEEAMQFVRSARGG
jgi:predicted DNA-binding antitoxin AbrB/MazE fold protein